MKLIKTKIIELNEEDIENLKEEFNKIHDDNGEKSGNFWSDHRTLSNLDNIIR